MTDLWDTPLADTGDESATWTRPRDVEAERTVAASLMERPELVDELDGVMDPVDFSDHRNAQVWYAVDELRAEIAADRIPPHAVAARLAKHRAEGRIVSASYGELDLLTLYGEAMPGSADYYARRVASKAAASRLVDLGLRAQQAGMSAAFDPDSDLATIQAALDGVFRGEGTSTASMAGDLVDDTMERAVTPQSTGDRVPTGFVDLDDCTGGGFRPGRMIVVGARPGVGKTLFGVGVARAAAIRGGLPTLFHTLEMGREEISDLIVAAESTVPHHNITTGMAGPGDAQKMAAARERIASAPLLIDEATALSIPALRNSIRTLVRTMGVRLVVVDYLQLMQAPKAESRQVAVAAMSRQLKLIAKEFGIVLIVLAQLNRASTQRTDKTPQAADLRESGAIEQDADMVILLHRPDMYEPESERAGEVDLIVDKHRGGHRARITAAAQPHYSRFVDMAADHTWAPAGGGAS
ncbi:replicative DNA helicase [Streptomyces sp. NPDC054784]